MKKTYYFIFICFLIISCGASNPVTKTPIEPTPPPIFSQPVNKHQIEPASSNYPKNIVLLIGDGLGLSQITAGLYNNQNFLNLERFFHIGLQKTHCSSNLITDSAASATAMACGKKTFREAIGVAADSTPVTSILELAEEQDMATGLVVTSTIIHATPASFVAHNIKRHNYEEIAIDFVNHDVDVMIGGGLKYFNRRKTDDRNLVEEFEKKNYIIKTYLDDEMENINIPNDRNFIYFTADNDPLPVSQGRSYLNIASQKTIDALNDRNDRGFFLLIEGSQIDWGGHANNADYISTETLDFDKTVGSILDWAEKDGETLVIVTADHETGGFSINLGSKMGDLKTAFTTKKHSATMVPVFAYGPGAENFQGIYENTEIFYKMKRLMKINSND